jgi:uncharacterized protein (TIGR02453 family)
MPSYFTPALFRFLRDLKAHNTREWFQANRERYAADVEAPMLRFVGDIGPALRGISAAMVADRRRVGGSMFRIHRDTRFSPDKSPYKTHVAAAFGHERRRQVEGGAPSFYLHLAPGDCLGGAGIYHSAAPTLRRIRLAIVERPKEWAAVRRTGLEIQGDRLTRVPAGVDRTHEFADDLRLKDFYTLSSFAQAEVCAEDFLERYVDTCRRGAPLVAFLVKAMAWRW